jgi:hypothetical protein
MIFGTWNVNSVGRASNQNEGTKKALQPTIHRKRRVGKPRKRWEDGAISVTKDQV